MNKPLSGDENTEIEKDVIINTIEIFIHTNIPTNTEPIPLTKKIFHNIPNLENQSEYPFFTENYLLPKEQIGLLSYEKRVIFFFNKEKFKDMLEEYGKMLKNHDEIIKRNIDIMLEMLLPTSFPIVGNYTDSYTEYIEQKPRFKITLQNSIPKMFSFLVPKSIVNSMTMGYSYLKINEKIHTVTRVVYLNDFLNNPKYHSIIDKYNKFQNWKSQTKNMNNDKIIKYKENIITMCISLINRYNTPDLFCNLIYNLHLKIYEIYQKYNRNYRTSLPSYNTNFLKNQHEKTIREMLKLFGRDTKQFELDISNYTPDFNNQNSDKDFCKNFNNQNDEAQKMIKEWTDLNKKNIRPKEKSTNKEYSLKLDEIYTYYKNIIENLNEYIKSIFVNESLEKQILREFNISIDEIGKIIESIFILNTIQETYFDETIKNIDTDTTSTNNSSNNSIKRFFNDNYKEYIDFINYIKKFIHPNRESNMVVSEIITEFINGKPERFNKYIKYVIGKYEKNNDKFNFKPDKNNDTNNLFDNKDFNTGIDMFLINSPKYEIHILVDLIEGQIDDDIRKYLYCKYKDELLVKLFPLIKKKQNKYIVYKGVFYSATKDIENFQKKKEQKENKGVKNPPQQGGGVTYLHFLNAPRLKNKTRKYHHKKYKKNKRTIKSHKR